MSNAILVLDSISPAGSRLATFELTMSVACLGQLTKHRILSINAESARAVPTKVAIEQVRSDPWMPRTWPINGKGMVPDGVVADEDVWGVRQCWESSARSAATMAGDLLAMGIHKEIANRLLAPFRRIKVVVSATTYENFFALRCAPDAQEEIRLLACEMRDLMASSVPGERDYHVPYVSFWEYLNELDRRGSYDFQAAMLVSAYRCARVSYGRTGASGLTLEEEAEKGRALAAAKHWSAFEHCAEASDYALTPSGNMVGWLQLRKELGG